MNTQCSIKEYYQHIFEGCCSVRCLRLSRKDSQFIKARELLYQELDLIELLRKLRFSQLVFEEILSLKRKDHHKNASKKVNIYDQDSSRDVNNVTTDFC